jgi:hypothetical protein
MSTARQAGALGYVTVGEAAELIGTARHNLTWYLVRARQIGAPMPRHVKIGARWFYDPDDVQRWFREDRRLTSRASRGGGCRSWPPVERAFLNSVGSQPLRPTADEWPDDGRAIPGATNPMTGRTIDPRWSSCLGCGRRFVSLGRHERFACDVPESSCGDRGADACAVRKAT